MKRIAILSAAMMSALLYGQETVRVPFSDATRARLVKVSMIDGSIHVRGYDGKDVAIETRHGGRVRRDKQVEGMHRIEMNPSYIAEEQDNVITIKGSPVNAPGSLDIEVPFKTSLQLSTINGGEITVDNVEGEL